MRLFIIVIVWSSIFLLFPESGQSKEKESIHVSANNAILMEQETGRVLYGKDEHEERPIASITKVMTALVAIRYGDLSDTVTVSENAVNSTGSSIYLQKDSEHTLEDLLYGLMLRSGNDAAVAIAEHIGGSTEGFVYLMNETAAYLGMTNTHFDNPHGLDDSNHYSSAYDMAILMREAYQNIVFREISGTVTYHAKTIAYPWHNKNKLLKGMYEPITGGKTGYTTKAGRTLITTAKEKELSLIAVTLHAPDDWNDHMNLYKWGFDHYKLMRLDKHGKKTFLKRDESVKGYIKNEVVYPLSNEEKTQVKKIVELKSETKDAAEDIGVIKYMLQSNVIKEIPIYNAEKNESKLSLWEVYSHILKVDING